MSMSETNEFAASAGSRRPRGEDKAMSSSSALVKNRTPAEIQITAEQILKEAHDRADPKPAPPQQHIADPEELSEYLFHTRKQFEDALRRNRFHFSHWLKYAAWEESQQELARARSIYERVLEIDSRNPALWLRYVEMEMRNRNVNLAHNLWDRACTLLPRVDQFWYKYAYMEEMLGNVSAARIIFERWMQWRPGPDAWESYIAFEMRYKEAERARELYRRMIQCHPDPSSWLRFARFEEQNQHNIPGCRAVFESAIQFLDQPVNKKDPTNKKSGVFSSPVLARAMSKILLAFAKFETRVNETERARAIYKNALSYLPREETDQIYRDYIAFEKQHGSGVLIEDAVASRRREVYEAEAKLNPFNYDVWFDYTSLEESVYEDCLNRHLTSDDSKDSKLGSVARVREVYERAVANVPPSSDEKRQWRRYIYLWLFYANFEEQTVKDLERTQLVYDTCLDIIPHENFTFGKAWIAYAKFWVRQKNIDNARKVLRLALQVAPKIKIFKFFIDLEVKVLCFDNARKLYSEYLAFAPHSSTAWIAYAELELALGDPEKARSIFESAIEQEDAPPDMPEVLWKSYIDFEASEGEHQRVRELYRRLLQRSTHVRIWVSFARQELEADDFDSDAKATTEDAVMNKRMERARAILEEANRVLRDRDASEERALLFEMWLEIEREYGNKESVKAIATRMPQIISSAKPEGSDTGDQEEYFKYEFPDDAAPDTGKSKLLQAARLWKQKMQKQQQNQQENEIYLDDKVEYEA